MSKLILTSLALAIIGGCLTPGCTATLETGAVAFSVEAPGASHKTEVPAVKSTTSVDPFTMAEYALKRSAGLITTGMGLLTVAP